MRFDLAYMKSVQDSLILLRNDAAARNMDETTRAYNFAIVGTALRIVNARLQDVCGND